MIRRVHAGVALVGSAVVMVLWFLAGPASAHAFEVEHHPAQGARLDRPPLEVLLQFSEGVMPHALEVTVRLASQELVATGPPRLEADRRVIRASLLDRPPAGVYLVSWHVTSAVDGHETAGEFAFAVGEVTGAVPPGGQAQQSLPMWRVVGSWLLLAGMSLGAGGLLSLRFLALGPADRDFVSGLAACGLGGALAGAGVHQLSAPAAVAVTRAGQVSATLSVLASVTAALLVGALVFTVLRRAPTVALACLGVAGAAWSARSHAAAYGGAAGGFVDFVHLASAAGWGGSLGVVAAVLWRPGQASGEARLRLAVGYARLALPMVVVVAGTGILSATRLVGRLGDLVATGYGQLLVAKVAVVAVVLALALLGRLAFLPRGHLPLLRKVTAGEVGLLTVVLVATAVLTNIGPPVGRAQADTLLGPAPLEEPVARAAGLAGSLTVSVAAGDNELQAEVFSPSGGVDGAQIQASTRLPDGRTVDLRPRSCGAGCFTQQLDLPRGATTITVDAEAPGWTGGQFKAQLVWPPAPTNPQLLRDLVERMSEVPELELVERVSSGPGATSGDTVATLSGDAFLEAVPYGVGEAVAVRPMPGQPDAIEFHMPAARMWFTIWLDEQGRVRRQRLVNPGHEVHHQVRYPRG